ncbi:DUF4179 domain-containing protein [Natronincola ferrireducens]|uniref:Anti-sigma-W factor RsiW n=1 Tax=Natronincola ferrireducens TaxID=393762 RepID=A0A1G9DWI0_9FIRM|nr:DUF4179 domain-containing protein [Natronincola ferrireducens]SDK68180.1 Putative zinc-finger [Natronincola ferrireducens]
MNCERIKNQLIDYLEGGMSNKEEKIIEEHMEDCEACKRELEELKAAIDYIKEESNEIIAPEDFIEGIKDKVKPSPQTTFKPPRKRRTAIMVAILLTLFVITAFATEGFGLLNWWRDLSIRESRSVYELLDEGYGDKVDLRAVDQDISITVESILADDIKTVILLEIEDLKGANPYITTRNGTRFEGSFEYDEDIPEEFREIGYSLLTLHSEEQHKRRFLLNLGPLKEKESTLSLNITALENTLTDSHEVVEGNWSFEIPVTKYDITTHPINQEVEVDGNLLLIEELVVGPTATLLTYSYDPKQNREYTLEYFSDIRLISNGKQYQSRFFGGYSSSIEGRYAQHRMEFDTIYLDNPKEVEISVGGYHVHVKANAYESFEINIDKSFPQQFEYKGSPIIIEDVIVGEDRTEVIVLETLEGRNYESLEVDFRTNHSMSVWHQGDWEEFYFVDREGNQVQGNNNNYFYYLMEMENPKVYTTKTRFILERRSSYQNLPPELWGPPEIIPTDLVIRGYKETRFADERVTIKLK